MLDNNLMQQILATSEILALEEAIVEKDYYVTQIIHAISKEESDYFQLIFAGGTCLAKAHKVVQRMSEDIDFKIQTKINGFNLNKTQLLKELKKFRLQINTRLKETGLNIGELCIRNEGRYFYINIDYPSVFSINKGLRPHILLEFTLANVHLTIEHLSIKTLIEDTLDNTIITKPILTQCIAINEAAIEKWVGLTRRIIGIKRTHYTDDLTLVRHIYDLMLIEDADKINTSFFTLAKSIVDNDAKQFKNQHPEYLLSPNTEINQSIELLKTDPIWQIRYQEFLETMVYGPTAGHEYESAMATIEKLSKNVIAHLNKTHIPEEQLIV
jgi:predicted nucleotidyltransferase component of viral defense system